MSNKVKPGWLKDASGERIAPKTFISQVLSEDGKTLDKVLDKTITAPLYAEVGQQLVVKKVDENGKPIDWEYVERPCYVDELEVLFDERITLSNGSLQRDAYPQAMNYKFTSKLNLEFGESYVVQTDLGSTIVKCKDLNGKLGLDASSLRYINSSEAFTHIYSDGLDGYDMFPNILLLKITHVKAKYLDTDLIPELLKKPISEGSYGYVLKTDGSGGTFWDQNNNLDLSSYVKTTQYATSNQAGLVKTNPSYGTSMSSQYIQIWPASQSDINSKSNAYRPITPKTLDYAVKAGLGNSTLTWTEAEKTKARGVIGAAGKNEWDAIITVEASDETPIATLVSGNFNDLKTSMLNNQFPKIFVSGDMNNAFYMNLITNLTLDPGENIIVLKTAEMGELTILSNNTVVLQ